MRAVRCIKNYNLTIDAIKIGVNKKIYLLFYCPKCSTEKEINEFGLRTVNGNAVKQSYCKNCRSKRE